MRQIEYVRVRKDELKFVIFPSSVEERPKEKERKTKRKEFKVKKISTKFVVVCFECQKLNEEKEKNVLNCCCNEWK